MSDCKVNGWILDGFPKTEGQINLLKQLKLTPTHVIIMEIDDEDAFSRLVCRKIDPVTGKNKILFKIGFIYNTEEYLPEDDEILERLMGLDEDKHEVVKRRYLEEQ